MRNEVRVRTSFLYSKEHAFHHEKIRNLQLPVKHGKKRYIARKGEKQKELPEGVNPVPPIPTLGSFYAQNCTREPDICIDGFTIDDNGNEQPVGGCYPSIECPEKPQT